MKESSTAMGLVDLGQTLSALVCYYIFESICFVYVRLFK